MAPWRTPTPRGRRRLEGLAKPLIERALERGAIECDTQMASGVDTTARGIEQRLGENERLADAHAKRDMELPNERQPYERGMGDLSRDPSSPSDYVGHRVLGEDVVDPLLRGINCK
jgi:hypothetical protein